MQVIEEFFNLGTNKHRQINNSIEQISLLPESFRQLLAKAIDNNPAVSRALDSMGLFTNDERVLKYYNCNYSKFDSNPDITANGTLGEREYVCCPNRDTCKSQGILCKIPFDLSPRQLEVAAGIGLGLVDKEICDKLNMKEGTLKNHKEAIQLKTGITRKPALAVMAYKLGFI